MNRIEEAPESYDLCGQIRLTSGRLACVAQRLPRLIECEVASQANHEFGAVLRCREIDSAAGRSIALGNCPVSA